MYKMLFTCWLPCGAMQFTSTRRHSMDELTLGLAAWSKRSLLQALPSISPWFETAGTDPNDPTEPVLPTPTDVPVPEPQDVPVPEPTDIPPPDPRDPPAGRTNLPEIAPELRSIRGVNQRHRR